MKVASVKYTWSRSASVDVVLQKVEITKNGVLEVFEFPPETQEFIGTVQAASNVSFRVESIDSENNTVFSDLYTFTLGDLEAPLPATNLFHEVLEVVDVPDEPVA